MQDSKVVSRLPWYNNQGRQAPEHLPDCTQSEKTEESWEKGYKSFFEADSNWVEVIICYKG